MFYRFANIWFSKSRKRINVGTLRLIEILVTYKKNLAVLTWAEIRLNVSETLKREKKF